MGSMLLDGLLGSTQCVWGFVDGARTHGTELKTMPLLLSSSLFQLSFGDFGRFGNYFDFSVEIWDRGIEERAGDFRKLAMESQV